MKVRKRGRSLTAYAGRYWAEPNYAVRRKHGNVGNLRRAIVCRRA